jgi:hypothetical protein
MALSLDFILINWVTVVQIRAEDSTERDQGLGSE